MTAQPLRSIFNASWPFIMRYRVHLWMILLTVCAGVFIVQGRADFVQAIDALAGSSPLWISIIVAAQIAALVAAAATYQILLRQVGHLLTLRRLVAIHLQRKVVATIVPAGGPASVYVYVRGTSRHGVSSEDALFTIGVRSLLGYASFVALLLPAIFLARPGGILLGGALALVAGFVLLAGLALLLWRHQQTLDRLLQRLPERIAAMLRHIRGHRTRPGDLAVPYLLAFLGQLASVLTLAAALYALGYSPSAVTVLAGYTVGTAAVTLSPAFQGIGIVEVSMALTLQQFGVPADVAIGATLLYRTATVWLPLILGGLSQAGRGLPLPSGPGRWLGSRRSSTRRSDALRQSVAARPGQPRRPELS